MTGVSREVRAVHVQRVVNASTRRAPLQRKIGSGLTPEEFRRLFKAGKAGHAGLKESLALIAHCLGWKTGRIVETGDAVVAERDIQNTIFGGETRPDLRASSAGRGENERESLPVARFEDCIWTRRSRMMQFRLKASRRWMS